MPIMHSLPRLKCARRALPHIYLSLGVEPASPAQTPRRLGPNSSARAHAQARAHPVTRAGRVCIAAAAAAQALFTPEGGPSAYAGGFGNHDYDAQAYADAGCPGGGRRRCGWRRCGWHNPEYVFGPRWRRPAPAPGALAAAAFGPQLPVLSPLLHACRRRVTHRVPHSLSMSPVDLLTSCLLKLFSQSPFFPSFLLYLVPPPSTSPKHTPTRTHTHARTRARTHTHTHTHHM